MTSAAVSHQIRTLEDYLGVQLFFVISGYCIMGAVESAERGPTPLLTFVRRRIQRIYPPYWLSIILMIGLATLTVGIARKSWWDVFPLTTGDWLLNLLLLQRLFGAPDAQLPYWSLSIEVQFYILMAVCLACPRWRSLWLVALSCLYAFWVWHSPFSISGTAMTHWPDFACGIAAYAAHHPLKFWRGIHWQLWGLSIIAIAVGWSTTSQVFMDKGDFILPIKQSFCLAFGFIVALLRRFGSVPLERAPLRSLAWVGTISYSLYLTHVLVATRVFNVAGRFMSLDGLNWYGIAIGATISQLLVGWLFFRYCESRWLNQASVQSADPRIQTTSHAVVAT